MAIPHRHASILEALAADEKAQVEVYTEVVGWTLANPSQMFNQPNLKYRVKRKRLTINGKECIAPVDAGDFSVTLAYTTPLAGTMNAVKFKHANLDDAKAHFELLAKVSYPD